ncbi:adenosylcobinamide amidohydrolase [Bacillus sp. DNRA2]|uniref:adenosylcobinamide amidohydrolase n=1 Tax=Bacillus sp. DNRA2 TaxID=2723053 RepID=UPI00145EE069|nr:adenosylcobinamide amidohydrolase [Bacillus sp. DNRA2]NMD69697.1 adenosylcobinamide amidohydrolase [Bacillus sp. DNRA2]
MQPFIQQNFYQSQVWPELVIEKKEDHILCKLPAKLETLSSAVYGGGLHQASHFVNWKVPLDYSSIDPTLLMEQKLTEWGYPVSESLGLQTAAYIHTASVKEMVGDEFKLVCVVTAGLGNNARAGRSRETFPAYQCSTINVCIFIDSSMTPAAVTNSIITATEAKAAALQDLQIVDENGEIATGTTTDSVVIAVSQNSAQYRTHQFAGVATSIGNAIGCLVYEAICKVVRYQED